jgi:hypothetical protein
MSGQGSGDGGDGSKIKRELAYAITSVTSANRTVTTTTADGKSITINRDSTGGGWFDQIKTRLHNPDNSRTLVLTVNNADLSLSSKTSYQQSVDTQAGLVGIDKWLMTVVAA